MDRHEGRNRNHYPSRFQKPHRGPAIAHLFPLIAVLVASTIAGGIVLAACTGSEHSGGATSQASPAGSGSRTPAATARATASITYTVQEGDTFWSIAAEHGISEQDLMAANPGVNAHALRPGMTVEIPQRPRQTPTTVAGLRMPVEGACLPSSDDLMPNAPRTYRNGIQEGVDFYPGYVCVSVGHGTPVLAAGDGTVTVATLDYRDLTQAEWDGILARSAASGEVSEDDLFVLRGRQVEIDHGDGTSTRYAHLSEIADGVFPGESVETGQVVGYVGNSGTPESITSPGAEMHLHFEIRVGDSFLGAGLPTSEVRSLYEQAFRR